MANIDSPFGFLLSRKRGKCVETNEYTVGAVQIIREGMPLSLTSGGIVAPYTGTGKILGVAAHSANGNEGDTKIAVYDDPEAVFEAQASTFAAADIGANALVGSIGTVDPLTGRSTAFVDGATYAVDASHPFKVVDFSDREGNEYGAFAKIYVQLNNSVRGSGDGSTGV